MGWHAIEALLGLAEPILSLSQLGEREQGSSAGDLDLSKAWLESLGESHSAEWLESVAGPAGPARPGDVLVVRVQTGEEEPATRAVVVLLVLPGAEERLLVCGISSRLDGALPEWDEVLRPGHPSFEAVGLRLSSAIRLGSLAVMPGGLQFTRVGVVDHGLLRALRGCLARRLMEEP
ncbi:MAG TPA: hypothetical protein VGN26_08670 [Armatimonadota bacterium]|jgi:hypothetical protein